MRNCGECLMRDVEIVELAKTGVCPHCKTDYGPEVVQPKHAKEK